MKKDAIIDDAIYHKIGKSFFGFISQYPAICAQGSSEGEVSLKLQKYSKLYFDYIGK